MSCKSRINGAVMAVAAAMTVAGMLGGCSDIYYDRRETIALGADDHIASNRVAQMIDPWPPASANRNIVYDGSKAASASERYRTNRVIKPAGIGTSSAQYQTQQTSPAAAIGAGGGGTP